MKTIKVFTAFSGYESQMMSLERLQRDYPQLSFELVGWCEIDEHAIASHNAVYPQYANRHYRDISKIDWNIVPDFDLFVYSSCCQDISRAGKQRGLKEGSGTRSALLWFCLEGIRIKQPKYTLLENVAALTGDKFVEDLQDWEDAVNDCGYNSYYKNLIAANFNVPQNRDRIFMVSIRKDLNQEYYFPSPIKPTVKAVDLLETHPESKYYFAEEDMLKFLCGMYDKDIPCGYDKAAKMATETIEGKILKQIITPAYKGVEGSDIYTDICPTLMASGGNGARWTNALGRYCQPLIVELWENSEHKPIDYNKIIKFAKPLAKKQKFPGPKQSKDVIENSLNNLKKNQFFRLRKMTPVEYLRFMDVPEDYIYRLTHPREGLKQLGYNDEEINKLFTVDYKTKAENTIKKRIKNSDKDIWKQAGNSIVVNVLYHVFRKLFVNLDPELI